LAVGACIGCDLSAYILRLVLRLVPLLIFCGNFAADFTASSAEPVQTCLPSDGHDSTGSAQGTGPVALEAACQLHARIMSCAAGFWQLCGSSAVTVGQKRAKSAAMPFRLACTLQDSH
jgi:hypothetical protein